MTYRVTNRRCWITKYEHLVSYLIQNFYYQNSSLRMTIRVRSAILARNFHVIYILLSNSSKLFNILSQSYPLYRYILKIANLSFREIAKVLFTKVKLMRYTPIGVNFPLSARYQALKGLDLLLNGNDTPTQLLKLSDRSITNPYFMGTPIVITPVSKKPFAYTFYKFMRMTLNMWFYWPKKYSITTHYTDVVSGVTLLRFLNSYYFKVYNV